VPAAGGRQTSERLCEGAFAAKALHSRDWATLLQAAAALHGDEDRLAAVRLVERSGEPLHGDIVSTIAFRLCSIDFANLIRGVTCFQGVGGDGAAE
jgi:hypothetical protein